MSSGQASPWDTIAVRLGAIAVEAGAILAAAPERGAGRRLKADGSPTTSADLASESLILARLTESWPDLPIVTEERGADAHPAGRFILVDPLDGTRDYLAGTDEYSVNLALVEDGRPVAAAIAAPGRQRVWIAGETALTASTEGGSRDWRPVATRRGGGGLVALVSRRHGDETTEACLATLGTVERRIASSALKFGLIASGEADLYLRCGPTMEWDIAAGDLLVRRAGGTIVGPDGLAPTYGHAERGYLNGPFAALGDPSLAARIALPPSCP